jgi:hypothetical protein
MKKEKKLNINAEEHFDDEREMTDEECVFYFCIKNRVNRLLQLTKAKQREKKVKDVRKLWKAQRGGHRYTAKMSSKGEGGDDEVWQRWWKQRRRRRRRRRREAGIEEEEKQQQQHDRGERNIEYFLVFLYFFIFR